MPLITVVNDPANVSGNDFHEVAEGTTLADWLIETYGPDGFAVPTDIYIGSVSQQTQLDLDDYAAVSRPITSPVFIIHRPLGLEGAALYAAYAAAAVVVAVAVVLLMPIPSLGGNKQSKKSPNNALSGQTNVARLLDRVPDIFGQEHSYPDLIAPTVTQFINHIKYQTEYLCVGRGFYLLEQFKTGETLISDVAGSTVTAFEPGQTPDEVLRTRQSNEVAGQEMIGPNEDTLVDLTPVFTVTYASGTDLATITGPSGTWSEYESGDVVNIDELYVTVTATDYNLSGVYIVDSAPSATAIVLQDAAIENANWIQVDAITENPITTTGGDTLTPVLFVSGQVAVLGPFTVPGDKNDQVWIDLLAPRGLASSTALNKFLTISLSFLFEEVDAEGVTTGGSFTYSVTLKDKTTDPRFWTFKITAADGLVVDQLYRVTGERITTSVPGGTQRVEEIRWSRLAGIENITAPDTTGTTRVIIETQATNQVAAIQERQFNVNATRKVITWDGEKVVGNMDTGEGLLPSRRMADGFLHYSLDPKLGARSLSGIDVDAIYAIQRELDSAFDGEKGEFSYTFDSQDTPALEEMRLFAQASRCFIFREGSFFGMTRDQEQPVARGLFNRRNKTPSRERRAIKFNRPLDNDGITLEYKDIDDNNVHTITFPDDLPEDDPHYGLPAALNPLKVDGIGIRQYTQAWDRAQYEFRRLLYQRVSVETEVTSDGLLVPLNARVQHVDGTRLVDLISDGEITQVDGLKIRTSQRCTFERADVYSVVLRNEEGSPIAPIIVRPHPDTEFGFVLSRKPGFQIVVRGDKDYQRGTLYTLGPDGNELADAYLVQRKTPDQDGYVSLELINYTPEYYAADSTTPPPKEIN